jgi:hypothetical protein
MKKRDDMLLETQKDNQRLKQLIILYQNRPKEAPRKELHLEAFEQDNEASSRRRLKLKEAKQLGRLKTQETRTPPANEILKTIGSRP